MNSETDYKKYFETLRTKTLEARNLCIDKAQSVSSLAGKVPFEVKASAFSLIIQYIDEVLNDKGDNAMIKLTDSLTTQVVKLSDVHEQQHRRKSLLGDKIIEAAAALEKGQAVQIDSKLTTYGNFAGKVSDLKEKGKLGKDIKVKKAGETFYLAKV